MSCYPLAPEGPPAAATQEQYQSKNKFFRVKNCRSRFQLRLKRDPLLLVLRRWRSTKQVIFHIVHGVNIVLQVVDDEMDMTLCHRLTATLGLRRWL